MELYISTGGDTKTTDPVCVCERKKVSVCVHVWVCVYVHCKTYIFRSSGVNTLLKIHCSRYLQRQRLRELSVCVVCVACKVPSQLTLVFKTSLHLLPYLPLAMQ